MMSIIKKFKVVISVVLAILILILFRVIGVNHFKIDAKKWAEPSVALSNLISGEQIGVISGEKLIINLGKEENGISDMKFPALNIPADSILRKNNLNVIRKHDGPVLLFSSETAVAARIWMVLSQMGFKNVFILTNDIDNEVFKSKFRPDTSVRPEL